MNKIRSKKYYNPILKRADTNTIFILLTTLIIVGIIIIIGVISIKNLITNVDDIEMAKFAKNLENDIKKMSLRKGSTIMEYRLPDSIGSMIFIDKTNKKALLRNEFVKKNPIVYDSIESNEKMNLFLFGNSGNLLKSFYIGEISVGQFEEQMCTGVGFLTNSFGKINIRMTNKPGAEIMLGEECTGIICEIFQGPFMDSVIPTPLVTSNVSIAGNRYVLQLAKDIIRSNDAETFYSPNGNINTTEWNIDSSQYELDRLYFSGKSSDNTELKFRIIVCSSVECNSFGDNADINENYDENDEDFYFTYSGQYIELPAAIAQFQKAKVNIIFKASPDSKETPSLDWVKLCYMPKTPASP